LFYLDDRDMKEIERVRRRIKSPQEIWGFKEVE
jgi:hypothetical protein